MLAAIPILFSWKSLAIWYTKFSYSTYFS